MNLLNRGLFINSNYKMNIFSIKQISRFLQHFWYKQMRHWAICTHWRL